MHQRAGVDPGTPDQLYTGQSDHLFRTDFGCEDGGADGEKAKKALTPLPIYPLPLYLNATSSQGARLLFEMNLKT